MFPFFCFFPFQPAINSSSYIRQIYNQSIFSKLPLSLLWRHQWFFCRKISDSIDKNYWTTFSILITSSVLGSSVIAPQVSFLPWAPVIDWLALDSLPSKPTVMGETKVRTSLVLMCDQQYLASKSSEDTDIEVIQQIWH